jgi:hypothetical protein
LRGFAHHAVRVGADIPHADFVTPDDEDVGFPIRRPSQSSGTKKRPAAVSSDKPQEIRIPLVFVVVLTLSLFRPWRGLILSATGKSIVSDE